MKIKKTASDILDKAILMRKSFNSAIIVAGGSGLRDGEGIPKQHRRIAAKRLYKRNHHSLPGRRGKAVRKIRGKIRLDEGDVDRTRRGRPIRLGH